MSKKKKTTHLALLIDRSGSMSGKQGDVIGSVNEFITEQKKVKGRARLTLIQFDDHYEVNYANKKLADVPDFTDYAPRGATALLDAVGRAINEIDEVAKKKDDVVIMIITDGHENASKEFNLQQIKQSIEACQSKGWFVLYAGAGVDAFDEAASYGISRGTTVSYDWSNPNATSRAIGTYAVAVAQYRRSGGGALNADALDMSDEGDFKPETTAQ